MEEVMRQRLFDAPAYTRSDVCNLFERYTGRPLSLDSKIELIQTLKDITLTKTGLSLAVDVEEKMYMSNNTYHVVYFRADPVEIKLWDKYMDAIYQEA